MSGNGEVRISDSDKKLFMLLLEQKCLTLELILRWLAPGQLSLPSGKRPSLYFRLLRLIRAGYLVKHHVAGYDLFLATQLGREAVSGLNRYNIPVTVASELDTVRHDLITAEIRHYLETYGAVDWVSDKVFHLHAAGVAQIPDGACTVGGKSVFVEVELSQKSKERYEKICEVYVAPKGPDRVAYFYHEDSVITCLRDLASNHKRIGFFKYEEGTAHPGAVTGVCGGEETSLAGFMGIV